MIEYTSHEWKHRNRKMSTCNQPVGFRITRIWTNSSISCLKTSRSLDPSISHTLTHTAKAELWRSSGFLISPFSSPLLILFVTFTYIYIYIGLDLLMRDFLKFLWGFSSDGPRCCWPNCSRKAPVVVVVVLRPLWDMVGNFQSMDGTLEPNISFKFVPISRPHPSATTHSHPCPPMLFKLRPCVQKLYHYQ